MNHAEDEILGEETEDNLEAMSPSEHERQVGRVIKAEYTYSGVLPPPDMLAQFNDIEPGLASRIVLMTEENNTHIRECESFDLKESHQANKRGQFFAFCLSIGALVLSGYGLYLDKLIFSSIFGLAGLTPIATAFLRDFRK